MIKSMPAKNFKAVPYLETSALMSNHPDGLNFSTTKPNVIVGPNGSGKSACLNALSLLTLSFYAGISALDNNYIRGSIRDDGYWAEDRPWGRAFVFMPGLSAEYSQAPALYYRPQHIPGNESFIAAAMMNGYCEEAKAYGQLTRDKSSGQQSLSVLERVQAALAGDTSDIRYRTMNWHYGTEPRTIDRDTSERVVKAEMLKRRVKAMPEGALPLVLMDEPEQSLDVLAETRLWNQIELVDTRKLQVIVATHSLYPLLHADKFHIIESVPGYAQAVLALM